LVEVAAIGYRSEGEVCPLPGWARYLIELGQFAVLHRLPDRRLVVGISVASRAYAALFAALGVATAAYEDPEKGDPRAHFDWLASLPVRTRLRYRHGTHLYCGELLGVEQRAGDEHLAIRTLSAGLTYLRRWDMCGDIQPLEPGEEFVRRRPLTANPTFLAACWPGLDPLVHASYTSLDCLLIGIKDALRPEALEQEFVCPVGAAVSHTGVLNDLLRCDAFEHNPNDHDRTTILSSFADEVPSRLKREVPPAVVFDGAAAYLRLRSHWRKSPWIVVIDRTSAAAIAAGDAFNQELALSLNDADVGKPPAGFEVRAYYEAFR
jgi:hypothetical protein